ncbi:D-alanine--D-alanine ligase [Roseomonas xinghualingensis]|uniref:D-alanine--D-alanine ligase n=1 Tax=Roseomonas xinghualingensis TaxID=2986475 RepID=UPI0021F13975|nr:D-alanine--D-alanine ligase [Roseomonas sp. SXEYE001]MCV4207439.1 D-alanine--D-alanine ligase [Roseomonas sp. SXEYE001]
MTRVTVLLGGMSSEREVSLSSGREIVAALREKGFEVTAIDPGPDLAALVGSIAASRPDVVFNALHGRFGEDGTIQGVLDWMGIPYTHSGLRASAVAMDKAAAKAAFAAAGLPVAPHRLIEAADLAEADPFPLPYVVKPLREGSSVGVFILREHDNRRAEIAATWRWGEIIAEPYIPGRELTVAVMEDRPLAVTEIATGHAFYDYDAKYADGGSRHTIPAIVPDVVQSRAMEIAVAAHAALGCSGVSRSDFRWDDSRPDAEGLVLLEVNTQPGMTPTSLVPEQAAYRGISFPELCAWMVRQARHDGMNRGAKRMRDAA